MSEDIEPALTDEEWAGRRVQMLGCPSLVVHDDGDGLEFVVRAGDQANAPIVAKSKTDLSDDLAAIIAIANDVLPAADRRKITRGMVRDIRQSAELALDELRCEYGDEEGWGNTPRNLAVLARRTMVHADALESFLRRE